MKAVKGKGDNGTTRLLSGERVPKCHERIAAMGDIDELTTLLGLLRIHLPKEDQEIEKEIRRIQSDLLDIGALISTWRDSADFQSLRQIDQGHIAFLEATIDRLNEKLPRLEHFILHGGHPAAAWAQFARSVCRRAERHTAGLSVQVQVGNPPKVLRWVLAYLNRLSDYLFTVGRYCNHQAGISDDSWRTLP